MTAPTATRPTGPEPGVTPPATEEPRGIPRWTIVLGIVVVWILVWAFTKGRDTLVLPGLEATDLHDTLTGFRDSVLGSRDANPVVGFTYQLGDGFAAVVDWLQRMVSIPNRPRPVPEVGWLGVVAVATWIGYAIANWRIAVLVSLSFLSFGIFGFWSDSIDLLIVTFIAVAVAVLIGMPVAVLIGTNRTANTIIQTVLDLMQTMPTFVYLLPVVLFFGLGASAAVVSTLIYALPPIIRIAGHGIRSVPESTIEATDSSGQNRWQRLVKVQLPMARRTIVVGLNQTIMAALSMAVIASFVNGPGLGKPVLTALTRMDIGGGLVPGALIVVMAIMLDRTTTAASQRTEIVARGGGLDRRLHLGVLIGGGVLAAVAVWMSRYYLWAAEFPDSPVRQTVAGGADTVANWVRDTWSPAAGAFKDAVSVLLLNPLQALLADSPWWLAGAAILALAAAIGGWRALVPTVICLAGIRLLDLWHDAMLTLTMTLVATLLVMTLALIFGVWMARRKVVDLALRPLLDAGQTIPPFVYLLPVLALFGPTRFTAIFAGVVYAAPAAIKLVADGVAGVSASTIEASRSTGATTWQEITKVQLPMARASLVLAANQGLLFVLAMVVIGGMVGAGALGYDVVLGFSAFSHWGKGAAAGVSIVLLGIMLDRIARAAAARTGGTHQATSRGAHGSARFRIGKALTFKR